jgi:diguanylate cyclase (GGDEF)-like protein/PAS domain S-box-containing protein
VSVALSRPRAAARPEAAEAGPRNALVALGLGTLLVLLFLAWSASEEIDRRLARERALAGNLTTVVAETIVRDLRDLETSLRAFVDQERALVGPLPDDPGSTASADALWSLIQLVFPQAEGALVLDAKGVRIAALGEWAGDESERHLRRFLAGQIGAVGIGGGSPAGIDVAAAAYRDGEPIGALSVHLGCATLCARLRTAVPEGYRLLAASDPALADGTADLVIGADGQLDDPGGSLLAERPLGETGWLLQARLEPAYAAGLVARGAMPAVVLGAALVLAAFLALRWVRRQRRQALAQRERLRVRQGELDAVLAATTDGILLTDLEGRIELVNPSAEMMFGRLAEDILGTDAHRLIPELFGSDGDPALLGPLTDGAAAPLMRETRAKRRDGEDFPVRVWLGRVRLDEGPHLLAAVQDLSEHAHNEEKLVFLEQRDLLTGLFNRKELEHRLSELMAEPGREGPHVLCVVDVDQLKLINDTCGHAAGDELIKQLAILFQAKMDAASVIARLGGDELVAVLPDRAIADAETLCEGFLQTVRNFPFTWRDQSFDVAVSIGLVEFSARNESPSGVLSKADLACHMAKARGRDRIHTYHEGDEELVRHHGDMRLVATISRALSEGRFHLYAQPIAPLAAGRDGPWHFEILVRMLDDAGRAVIPDRFIPAAERYILMPAVDRWIINRLFGLQAENLRAWHAREPDRFLFAVNLSGTSVLDDGFLRYLKRQFTDWDVPYPTICFEITETAAILNLTHARDFMEELASLGCQFALDDFGAGFSSYAYLRDLPVDYLKIDGSFVRGLTEDPVNRAMVESINHIGHVLGLQTIAEWAEDEATLAELRDLAVDFAQGFIVGESLPVSELTLADTQPASTRHAT